MRRLTYAAVALLAGSTGTLLAMLLWDELLWRRLENQAEKMRECTGTIHRPTCEGRIHEAFITA